MRNARNRNLSDPKRGRVHGRKFSDPPKPKPSLFQRFRALGTVWQLVIGVLSLMGGYVSWLSVRPRIEIKVSDTAFYGNTPTFTINNNGFVSARDVTWGCDGVVRVFRGQLDRQSPPHYEWEPRTASVEYADIGTLPGLGSASRRCPTLKMPLGSSLTNGTVVVAIVTYKLPFLPFKEEETAVMTLEGEENSGGHWEYRGEALSDSQASYLKANGYRVEDRSSVTNSPEYLDIHKKPN